MVKEKQMTKSELRAALHLIVSLTGKTRELGSRIGDAVGADNNFFSLIDGILEGSRTEVDGIMNELEQDGYLDGMPDGEDALIKKAVSEFGYCSGCSFSGDCDNSCPKDRLKKRIDELTVASELLKFLHAFEEDF